MASLKKTAQNASVYVILGFLAPAVNFFLIPIYTRYLSTSDFGIITIAGIIVGVLVNLMGLGLNGAFSRYYYEELNDRSNQLNLFSTALLTNIFAGLIIGIIFWFTGQYFLSMVFQNNSFTISLFGIFLIFTSIGLNLQAIIQSLYRNDENIRKYAIWAIAFFLSAVTGIFIGVVVLEKGAYGSIGGRMWGIVIPLVVFLIIFYIKYPPVWKKKQAVVMIQYGWPLVIYLMISLAFGSVDKIVVERYFKDLSVLGVYGFALLIAAVMEIFLNAVNSAINPQVFRLLKDDKNNSNEINQLLSFVVFIMLLILIGLIVMASPAITWFINPDYHDAINYLPLLFIGYIPRIYFTIFSIPLFFYNKTKVLPWISAVSLVVAVVLNVILIPIWGIYGICVAILLTRTVQCVFAIIATRHYKLPAAMVFSLNSTYPFSGFLLVGTFLLTYIQFSVPGNLRIWLFMPLALLFAIFFWVRFKEVFTNQISLLLTRK